MPHAERMAKKSEVAADCLEPAKEALLAAQKIVKDKEEEYEACRIAEVEARIEIRRISDCYHADIAPPVLGGAETQTTQLPEGFVSCAFAEAKCQERGV